AAGPPLQERRHGPGDRDAGVEHVGDAVRRLGRALLRLLTPPPRTHHPTPPATGEHGQGLVQFVLAAHEGQRNTRLFWAACRAYENGIGPDLSPALIDAAVHTGLSEREARSTLASAARMTGRRP
ncbi:primase alpha helix C-terminal domain-containing protein, partial [Streptomyces sp. NPDC052015]|uniref:primase alpha helix C-terminal domain-containing protein n=1 Tax=Streptomyces sp. NPDC052015 TaxID=3154755 RepID=UPI003424985F